MPYRRSYGRRRGGRRRARRAAPSFFNWRYTVGDMAMSAYRGVNYLRGLVNAELHKYDFYNSFGQGDSGGVNSLVEITQGDGDQQRTGNSIFVRSIDVNGLLKWTSTGPLAQVVTIWLVIDNQQISDTGPIYSDFADTASPSTHLNPDTVGRFAILSKRTLVVSADKPTAVLKIRRILRHHVRYNGALGTDYQKGVIYMFYIGDAPAAGATPTLSFQSRVSFHDN